MNIVVRREIRQRGPIGWVFLVLFVGFNLLMLVWLFSYWATLADVNTASSAERAGLAIGGTIGTGFLVFFWAAGAMILGLFVLLTRGPKTIVEETKRAKGGVGHDDESMPNADDLIARQLEVNARAGVSAQAATASDEPRASFGKRRAL